MILRFDLLLLSFHLECYDLFLDVKYCQKVYEQKDESKPNIYERKNLDGQIGLPSIIVKIFLGLVPEI